MRRPAATADPAALVTQFRELHGWADAAVEQAAAADPLYFARYLQLATVAMGKGPLDAKMVQFVLIAANASITHNDREHTQRHIRRAQALGATGAELREVLQISSVLGIHGYMVGSTVMLEEAQRAAGKPVSERPPLTQREEAIKADFTRKRQYWSEKLQDLLVASPDFWEAYAGFSGHTWTDGVLSPKQKELLYVAIDVQTTHLFEPGTRIHMANAFKQGATREEIIQVAEIVSCMGIQTYLMGLPMLKASPT
jgi:alkylhydroperoxidase/carboxymuconolactone decarboxylase family protein YurZ